MFFKVAQKVNVHLGNLSVKICHQNLSKIAQSGHTDSNGISSSGQPAVIIEWLPNIQRFSTIRMMKHFPFDSKKKTVRLPY